MKKSQKPLKHDKTPHRQNTNTPLNNNIDKPTTIPQKRGAHMKHTKSEIGKHGICYTPVEGYKRKDGKKVPPHYKKTYFKWHKST